MNRFSHFSEEQKELFFSVIDELSLELYECSAEDIKYLQIKIDNNKPLNAKNLEILRNSTSILRLLKEVKQWKPEKTEINIEDELNNKKTELINYLKIASQKNNEK